MGADVGGGGERRSKKGKKKRVKRVAIRIDMTPMVDVAFLLLIFYMVTTVFKTPQALEMTLPPDEKSQVQIPESKILTLRVLPGLSNPSDSRIYWNRGPGKPESITFNDLGRLFTTQKGLVDDLIVLIKIDRKATYQSMVRITDELGLAELDKFSLVPLSDDDRKAVGT